MKRLRIICGSLVCLAFNVCTTLVIAAGLDNVAFDLTSDGLVDGDDLAAWLVEGGDNNPSATGAVLVPLVKRYRGIFRRSLPTTQ